MHSRPSHQLGRVRAEFEPRSKLLRKQGQLHPSSEIAIALWNIEVEGTRETIACSPCPKLPIFIKLERLF